MSPRDSAVHALNRITYGPDPGQPDFRDLFGEVVSSHLGARRLDQIFPGRAGDPGGFPGAFGT
jgi:hypothetical protein